MSEKQESEEFEEDEDDAVVDSDDGDLDRLLENFDRRKKNVAKPGEPAWRKLERKREEKATAALLSDFDDYDLNDRPTARAR